MIYAVSDLHGKLPHVPEDAELLILGGDICPDFRPYGNRQGFGYAVDKGGVQQGQWLNTIFRQWLNDLAGRGVIVVAIWGNHDFVGEHPYLVPDLPWTLLKDETITVPLPVEKQDFHGDSIKPRDIIEPSFRTLRIHGTPWVPGLPYWAFYGSEPFLRERAGAIPEGLDILVSHGPPYGLGDFIPTSKKQQEKYGNYDGQHVGDKDLTCNLTRIGAKLLVCGHIHEARGSYTDEESGTKVYNVAAVDELYRLHHRPLVELPI